MEQNPEKKGKKGKENIQKRNVRKERGTYSQFQRGKESKAKCKKEQ